MSVRVNLSLNQAELNTVKSALYDYAKKVHSEERKLRAKALASRAQGLYRLILENIDIRDLEH